MHHRRTARSTLPGVAHRSQLGRRHRLRRSQMGLRADLVRGRLGTGGANAVGPAHRARKHDMRGPQRCLGSGLRWLVPVARAERRGPRVLPGRPQGMCAHARSRVGPRSTGDRMIAAESRSCSHSPRRPSTGSHWTAPRMRSSNSVRRLPRRTPSTSRTRGRLPGTPSPRPRRLLSLCRSCLITRGSRSWRQRRRTASCVHWSGYHLFVN